MQPNMCWEGDRKWAGWMVDCSSLMPWQHLRSYQDMNWLGDNTHSWYLYSAVTLGDQTASTVTWYPTQSHYPGTELTNPFSILIMLSAWLGRDTYQFLSHWFDSTRIQTHGSEFHNLPNRETDAQLNSASPSGHDRKFKKKDHFVMSAFARCLLCAVVGCPFS